MRARVYDKKEKRYFVSEVLGIINTGYFEKYLVTDGDYLMLIDSLDKEIKQSYYPVKINVISYDRNSNWVRRKIDIRNECNDGLNTTDKELHIYEFEGYSFIYNNLKVIATLLTGNMLKLADCSFIAEVPNYDKEDWNYIRNSDEIKDLMTQFVGFHDSVIKDLSYVSGSYTTEEGSMMCCDDIRTISVRFDSQQAKSITVEFAGLILLNLRPAQDNYFSDIYGAYIEIKDEMLYFFDDTITSIDESHKGTWIKALEGRWKFVV